MRGLAGTSTAALFACAALAGDPTDALAHLDAAMRWLPEELGVNGQGRWSAAMSVIHGVAFLGDRARLAALDPVGRRLAAQCLPVGAMSVGPSNSELCAGLTAAAAGDPARAERHFAEALRHAQEIPDTLLEPTVQYWFGCFERDHGRPEAGRERLQAALQGFTRLKMPLHRDLASRALAEA